MRFTVALALISATLASASPAGTEAIQDMNPSEKETSMEKHATISTLLHVVSGGRFELEKMNAEQLTALEEVERIIEGMGESFEKVPEDGGRVERRQWHYSYYPVYRPHHHHGHHGYGYGRGY